MEVAERQQSLCLLLEEGVSRKSRALQINCRISKHSSANFKSGWISSENVFVGPTRKGKTLPKLADLLKNELFVVLEEGESFSTRVCSPCRTNLETALRCFRKLVEFIPKRIRFALPFTWVSSMMNTSVGTSMLKQFSLKLANGSVC